MSILSGLFSSWFRSDSNDGILKDPEPNIFRLNMPKPKVIYLYNNNYYPQGQKPVKDVGIKTIENSQHLFSSNNFKTYASIGK